MLYQPRGQQINLIVIVVNSSDLFLFSSLLWFQITVNSFVKKESDKMKKKTYLLAEWASQ